MGPGPKTVKGAQNDPNYVSRLLLDCVVGGPKITVTPLVLIAARGAICGLSLQTLHRGLFIQVSRFLCSGQDRELRTKDEQIETLFY